MARDKYSSEPTCNAIIKIILNLRIVTTEFKENQGQTMPYLEHS